MIYTIPTDQRVKLKESEKKDKYLDLARELKKLWNMKVTIIPILIGVFDTATKSLVKWMEDFEKEDEWRTSKLLLYWDRPEHWKEPWRNSSETPSANADLKNSEGDNNNNNNNYYYYY